MLAHSEGCLVFPELALSEREVVSEGQEWIEASQAHSWGEDGHSSYDPSSLHLPAPPASTYLY